MNKQVIASLVFAFAVVGCDKKSADPVDQAAQEAVAAAEAAAQVPEVDVASLVAELLAAPEKELDKDTIRHLFVDFKNCEYSLDSGIDRNCIAATRLQQVRAGNRRVAGGNDTTRDVARELLNHESPAVRIHAAQTLTSFFGGTGVANAEAIAERMAVETDPAVLRVMVDVAGSAAANSPKAAQAILNAASHENAKVRRQAVYAMTRSENFSNDGYVPKLIEMIENDSDIDVRAAACEKAGDSGDDRLMPVYEKYTINADDDKKLYDGCMKGLVNMWWSFPFHRTSSEAAYNLTLQRFNATPRTDNTPLWTVMSNFQHMSSSNYDQWKQKAGFFDAKALRAALAAVARDRDANWLARNGAIDSLAAHGGKAEIEALLREIPETSTGRGDSHVRRKLIEVQQKL